MRKQNVLLTVWLIAPILIVVFLCYWILLSLQTGPKMHAAPIGAGAGQTGGANAIGDYLASRRAAHQLEMIVEDRTNLATPDQPLLIALADNEWEGVSMKLAPDGAWVWTGEATLLVDGFEILWRDSDGKTHRDKGGRRVLRITAGQQQEVVDTFVP